MFEGIKARLTTLCPDCKSPLEVTEVLERENGFEHRIVRVKQCPRCGWRYAVVCGHCTSEDI